MQRGEIWWADTGHGGDRPVLVLTRDPVADVIGAVVVAALTTTVRGVMAEMPVGTEDGLDRDGVVSFDNLNTLPRHAFRSHVTTLGSARMAEACRTLNLALGCGWT